MNIKMVVGLGNLTEKYKLTRHNIGFIIIDALVDHYKAKYGLVKLKQYPAIEIKQKIIHNTNVIFLKPQDWMNNSGVSIGRVVDETDINPKDIMVAHDDMDFSFGDIKIKASGSSGRHNGVQSVIDLIGKNFTRFRIGIGRSTDPNINSRNYVLSKFDTHEQKHFPELFKSAIQTVDSFIMHGAQKTMSTFNRKIK